MASEFPAEIAQYIDQQIESLPQLETLLLMRSDPARSWTAEEIAKELYIAPNMAGLLLADMVRRGQVMVSPPPETRYSYRSGDVQADQLIDQLASVYQDRRVAVIAMIYSKPLNKVQTFADAFRLRKENPQ